MPVKATNGWGGKRDGAGAKVDIPAGTGRRRRVTVTCGEDLFARLQTKYPDLSPADTLRAAMWEVLGEPKHKP